MRDVHRFWSPRLAAAGPRAVPGPSRGAPRGAQHTVPRKIPSQTPPVPAELWQLVPAEELCSDSLKAWWKPSCLCRLWCDLPRHVICQISSKKYLSSWKELNKLVSSLKTAGKHQKWELCAFPGCQKCRNATASKWSCWPGGTWLGETGKRWRSRSWTSAFQGVLQQL